MVSEKSLANLKPPKPGERRNPKGRPPKLACLTSCLKEELLKIDPKTGKTNAQLIAERMVADAKAGVASARAEIFERVEGKVTQPISGEGGGAIPLNIIVKSSEDKKALEETAKRLG